MTRREWQLLNNRHSHTCVCCQSVHGGNHYRACSFSTEDHAEGACFDCWQIVKHEQSIAIPGGIADRETVFTPRVEVSLEVLRDYLQARVAGAQSPATLSHWQGRLNTILENLLLLHRTSLATSQQEAAS